MGNSSFASFYLHFKTAIYCKWFKRFQLTSWQITRYSIIHYQLFFLANIGASRSWLFLVSWTFVVSTSAITEREKPTETILYVLREYACVEFIFSRFLNNYNLDRSPDLIPSSWCRMLVTVVATSYFVHYFGGSASREEIWLKLPTNYLDHAYQERSSSSSPHDTVGLFESNLQVQSDIERYRLLLQTSGAYPV